MKSFLRLLSILVLLAALVGAMILVKNNQETRRGAAANETSSSIIPDCLGAGCEPNGVRIDPNGNVIVHLWLNPGAPTDILRGAELKVKYNPAGLKLLAVDAENEFSKTTSVDDGVGTLTLGLINMQTAEVAGNQSVAKLTFQALANGQGDISVLTPKIMVKGQTALWDVAVNNPSKYTIGPVVLVATATMAPTATVTSGVNNVAIVKTGDPGKTIYYMGDLITNNVTVSTTQGKISGFSLKIFTGVEKVSLADFVPGPDYTVLKKEVDTINGSVTIVGVINKPAAELPSVVSVGAMNMVAKTVGTLRVMLDSTANNEVSGVDLNGGSIKFSLQNDNMSLVNILLTPVATATATPIPTATSTPIPTATMTPIPTATSTPVPTATATATPVPKCQVCTSGQLKSKGNANCDGVIDLLDFEYWRDEAFDKGGMGGVTLTTWNADFNCDTKVDLLDFETWRFTFFP